MSSQSQASSQTAALLKGSRPADQLSRSLMRGVFTFSPEIRIVPVVIASTLAVGIPSTTLIELLQQAVCKIWYILRGAPAFHRTGGPISPEFCDAPEITRYFSIALAVQGVLQSIISIVGLGIFSRISSRYGRKPAFLLVLLLGIISSGVITASQYMPDWLAGWVFLLGTLCGMSGSPLSYLIDMYIVDLCSPEDRAAALSKILGLSGLGGSVSYALGGSITVMTGNPIAVVYIAIAIYVVAFLYVISFLPESFPKEKRNALADIVAEPSTDGLPGTTRFAYLRIFEPLKLLIPTRGLDGSRNWRLAWCAAHTFLYIVAESYTWSAWMVLATSKYHLTPATTGFFLTVISVSSTIVLTMIVPPLVRYLRPYYPRNITHHLHEEEGMVNGENPESETSDHLYVHLAMVACVITSFAFFGAAASMTTRMFVFSGIFIGIAYIHGPMLRNLVAESVDPLKQGDALAAISMVYSISNLLSPVIMGSIFSATIETMPLFLFYVRMVIILASCSLLFFVRDADRYQKPHEE